MEEVTNRSKELVQKSRQQFCKFSLLLGKLRQARTGTCCADM